MVAVSGGVDSVALLHMLRLNRSLELIVAHYDHGIRLTSSEDRIFVEKLAEGYGLPFFYEEGRLGPGTSEAKARNSRYGFLRKVQLDQTANGLITAHHQDDVLETAIINMLRGTGRKGLSALADRPDIHRPLLSVPKQDVINYALAHNLKWREDETNADDKYLRNYVRHNILARFKGPSREKLLQIVTDIGPTNQELDELLLQGLPFRPEADSMDRIWFCCLPHDAAREVLASWLRAHGSSDFNKSMIERLVVAAKTAHPGSNFDVLKGVTLAVNKDNLALERIER